MRRGVAMILASILVSSFIASAEGGVNEGTSLEGTDLKSHSYQNEVSAGVPFEVTVTVKEESADNVTSVSWITQECVNSGICYPPETREMTSNAEGEWSGAIVPEETVSYLNWRIEVSWEDGNTTSFPESGFGWKVWSDCWYDNGTWGGKSTSCQEGGLGSVPGFSASIALTSAAMAVLMGRRD